MFCKLLWYDLKNGFRSTYRRYIAAAVAFCIMFVSAYIVVYSYNVGAKPETPVQATLGNTLLYAFGGMDEYIPEPGNPFRLPAFWLLSYLLLAYITLYYPFNDLEEFGQNILIRSGGRQLWWLSKCVWNVASVVAFFLLAWAIFAVGCLVTGNSLSMELSPDIFSICQMVPDYQPPATLTPQILVLPLLVMAALNLFQMTLSLFIKPFYSYIVTAAILLISAYYVSPCCIGNYAMPLRSHMVMANGVGLNTGMLVSVIILVVAVIVGGLVFQRRDILKGEG